MTIPETPGELWARIESARHWAGTYARLGWPVTPACDGLHPRCVTPDRHPRDVHWATEATTDPRGLDTLWATRPSYGVIGRTGDSITALILDADLQRSTAAALADGAVSAPLLRVAAQEDAGPARLYAIVRCTGEPVTGPQQVRDRITVHPPGIPLPLPGADAGGHAAWIVPPAAEHPVPTTADVVTALTPLYLH